MNRQQLIYDCEFLLRELRVAVEHECSTPLLKTAYVRVKNGVKEFIAEVEAQ